MKYILFNLWLFCSFIQLVWNIKDDSAFIIIIIITIIIKFDAFHEAKAVKFQVFSR